MKHTTAHPQAGQIVTVLPAASLPRHDYGAPLQFRVEDWADIVFGGTSWMFVEGNPSALAYAVRSSLGQLPLDDQVVYGHDMLGSGHLVHVTEIEATRPVGAP
ncbi:hypothetical protein ACFT7S_28375 [Streptomyces sp. NPDC057136]|uniref:hypothetical protein n=1 Tax=Streptomyces sp. NPDC057136 TaxID=3346029 RepID=UPI003634D121